MAARAAYRLAELVVFLHRQLGEGADDGVAGAVLEFLRELLYLLDFPRFVTAIFESFSCLRSWRVSEFAVRSRPCRYARAR